MSTAVITEVVTAQIGTIDQNTGRMFTTNDAAAARAAGLDRPDPLSHPWVRRTLNLHPPMGFPPLGHPIFRLPGGNSPPRGGGGGGFPGEEVEADSREEVEADSQEEVEADSREEAEVDSRKGPHKDILREAHPGTDSSAIPPSFTMETPRELKNSWRHGSFTKELIEGQRKWTICIDGP